MPIVDRTFIEVDPVTSQPVGEAKPLSAHFGKTTIVLLGDPGIGKSTAFEKSAKEEPNAIVLTVGDFLYRPIKQWRRKTLYLDGLDEQRSSSPDGRTILARIAGNIENLGRPPCRISCRGADWYGGVDISDLQRVASAGAVTVLRIEPLTEADIVKIAADSVPDPDAFVEEARRRDVYDLLSNPQTLNMILEVVKKDGAWPSTKTDLFQSACEILAAESNARHRRYNPSKAGLESILDAAGYLCGAILCGLGDDAAGVALDENRADRRFPLLSRLKGDQTTLEAAVRRRLFRGEGVDRFVPVHRTVAEYLAARHFARLLREDHVPVGRLTALLIGSDGGVLTELRGLHAWLTSLCPEHAGSLIRRDPFGVVLYGDTANFTTEGKMLTVQSLRSLAERNPHFRSENWGWRPFGGLASPELEPLFKTILEDPSQPPAFVGCILDAVRNGRPLPGLGDHLLRYTRNEGQPYSLRIDALDAFVHVCPDRKDALVELLDDVHSERVKDDDRCLRGVLLEALYPDVVKPGDIIKYIVADSPDKMAEYGRFVDFDMLEATPAEDIPDLLDAIAASGLPCLQEDRLTGRRFIGRLLSRGIASHGDKVPVDCLYRWLGVAIDQYDISFIDEDESQDIRKWLEARPAVVEQLYAHWLGATPPEKLRVKEHRLFRRLQLARLPTSLASWMLDRAATEPDVRAADFLFRAAVSFRVWENRPDAPSIEDLLAYVDNTPRFAKALAEEFVCDISGWRRENALREKASKAKREKVRAENRKNILADLDRVWAGVPTGNLLYLAKLHFGLFSDVDRETTPINRIITEVGDDIAAAASKGFVAALDYPEIPSPDLIGDAYSRSRVYPIGYIALAGMDLLAEKSADGYLTLSEAVLKSALAFHHVMLAGNRRPWVERLYRERPDLAADAMGSFWRAILSKGSSHIPGLESLARVDDMVAIARILAVPLLRDFHSTSEDNLTVLLKAALRRPDRDEFSRLAKEILGRPQKVAGVQKLLWAAAAFLVRPRDFTSMLERNISRDDGAAWKVINLLGPFLKSDSKFRVDLAPPVLGRLIAILGKAFAPAVERGGSRQGAFLRSEVEEVRDLIYLLANDLSREGIEVLASLKGISYLKVWRDYIAKAVDLQTRNRRETGFPYVGVYQVVNTLNAGSPANAADLQALVSDHLRWIGEDIHRGPEDGYKAFWNNPRGKPSTPKVEEECRDRLLEKLKGKLRPHRVVAGREGQYAGGKKSDIKVECGDTNIPVEIKRHFHRELWTAPQDQLKRLYMRDPGTKDRGIYLVFWFGINADRRLPRPPRGMATPTSPAELEKCIVQSLDERDRSRIEVMVVDVSMDLRKPPKVTAAARKRGIRSRKGCP